jgi:hypothetical protein
VTLPEREHQTKFAIDVIDVIDVIDGVEAFHVMGICWAFS